MKASRPGTTAAYSLLEVLIAASVLILSIAAAAAMALAVAAQQETNTHIARAVNLQEQAARLYQLGLAPATIAGILPTDPAVTALTFDEPVIVTIGDIPNLERTTCTMTYRPSPAGAGAASDTWTPGDAATQRTNSLVVVRPSIR
jgi:type II secretory pathway pseudopilin PulG